MRKEPLVDLGGVANGEIDELLRTKGTEIAVGEGQVTDSSVVTEEKLFRSLNFMTF